MLNKRFLKKTTSGLNWVNVSKCKEKAKKGNKKAWVQMAPPCG